MSSSSISDDAVPPPLAPRRPPPPHSLILPKSGHSSQINSTDVKQLSTSCSSTSNVNNKSDISCVNSQVENEAVAHASSDWTADDPCMYYTVRSNGCTEPRSCRDCLNVDVGDGYSCMVNQFGRCVRMVPTTYVEALDFERQEPSNDDEDHGNQKVQFPAFKVDYCRHGDKKCKKCKKKAFQDVIKGKTDGSLTKFCYGKKDCVCIAVCEAPIWKELIGQTVCNGTQVKRNADSQNVGMYGGAKEKDEHGLKLGSFLAGMAGGLAVLVALVAAVWFARYRRRENGEGEVSEYRAGSTQDGEDAAAGDIPVRESVTLTLNLFGWQAMRSELIEREKLLLAGVEDFSNVQTGYLQLLDVDASAPPPEEDESSAPVLLVPLAGASAPSFSPRGVAALASIPSAPPASPSAPPASPSTPPPRSG